MKALVIWRRELSSYFGSLIAYLLIAIFLFLSGYFFYSDLAFFILFGGFALPTGLWRYVFLDMRLVTLLILPLLTMRLFAEEKKLGTIELLWTYPVRDREIVIGKFFACLTFFVVMLLPTILYPILLSFFYPFDPRPVALGYFGLFLLGTAFIACGMLISSLTENQVMSAMGTYGIIVFFWFLTWNEAVADERVIRFLINFSLFDHFYNFPLGVMDTRDVVFFLLFVTFFFMLTVWSLESRTWRGVK